MDQADPKNERSPGTNPILADLQTLRGELELQLHLGTMEAKDAWQELKTRVGEFEREVESGKLMDDLAGAAEKLMGELQAFHKKLQSK